MDTPATHPTPLPGLVDDQDDVSSYTMMNSTQENARVALAPPGAGDVEVLMKSLQCCGHLLNELLSAHHTSLHCSPTYQRFSATAIWIGSFLPFSP